MHSFQDYWIAITVLESQEQKLAIQAANGPYMKKADREKLWRSLERPDQSLVDRNADKMQRLVEWAKEHGELDG